MTDKQMLKRFADTFLAIVVPFFIALFLVEFVGISNSLAQVVRFSLMLVWLARIWWPRKAQQ